MPYVLQWEKKVGDAVRYRTIPSALYIRELNTWAPLDARHRYSPRSAITASPLRFSRTSRASLVLAFLLSLRLIIDFSSALFLSRLLRDRRPPSRPNFVEARFLSPLPRVERTRKRRSAEGGALSPLCRVERGDRRNGRRRREVGPREHTLRILQHIAVIVDDYFELSYVYIYKYTYIYIHISFNYAYVFLLFFFRSVRVGIPRFWHFERRRTGRASRSQLDRDTRSK